VETERQNKELYSEANRKRKQNTVKSRPKEPPALRVAEQNSFGLKSKRKGTTARDRPEK